MRTESPSVRDAATFDFNAPMVVITTQEIIEGLERFAAIHGKPSFRQKDFMAWKDRPFDMQTVVNRFGSWRKALAEIGGKAGHPGSFSSEELIANLESVWRQLGRRPSINQLKPRGICGAGPYQRRWGSVRRACRRLAAYHRGEISREELLRDEPRDPRITRKPLPVELRWKILKRDNYRCTACGKSPATHPGTDLEVDHIFPVARGGSNEESNLRALCGDCNRGKRDAA